MITQKYINDIAYKIVGCAIEVHKQLGTGLLESVYEECLIEEMNRNGLIVKKQIFVPIIYKEKELELRSEVSKQIERGKVDLTVFTESTQVAMSGIGNSFFSIP